MLFLGLDMETQDCIESRTLDETRLFLAAISSVKTKPPKHPKKSKGNWNKLMSRVPAIVGFGVELDEESRANDQDIRRGNTMLFYQVEP